MYIYIYREKEREREICLLDASVPSSCPPDGALGSTNTVGFHNFNLRLFNSDSDRNSDSNSNSNGNNNR